MDKKIQAIFFKSRSGREPVREFLQGLSKEEKKKVGEDIKACETGWPLGEPICKKLRDRIYEVRTSVRRGAIRVFFSIEECFMLLLHAVWKKRQKADEDDIRLAIRRRNEYVKADKDE